MHDISGTLYQTFVQIDPHSSEISLLIWESNYRNFEAL